MSDPLPHQITVHTLPQGWIELPLRDARVLSVRADKCEHVVPGAQNNGACHVAIGPGEDMVYEIALPADEVLSRIAAAQGEPAPTERRDFTQRTKDTRDWLIYIGRRWRGPEEGRAAIGGAVNALELVLVGPCGDADLGARPSDPTPTAEPLSLTAAGVAQDLAELRAARAGARAANLDGPYLGLIDNALGTLTILKDWLRRQEGGAS